MGICFKLWVIIQNYFIHFLTQNWSYWLLEDLLIYSYTFDMLSLMCLRK